MSTAFDPKFKVLVVGSAGVGKSTFVARHHDGSFIREYRATMGAGVSPLKFNTSVGRIILNMWDCAGQYKFGGLGDCYYISAHAAIIMFDVTSPSTYNDIPAWYEAIRGRCPHIPIVICGNKVDCKYRKVVPKRILFHRKVNCQYYDISVKSCYNFEKPLLYLMRKLTGYSNLLLVDPPELSTDLISSSKNELVKNSRKIAFLILLIFKALNTIEGQSSALSPD